MASRLKLQEELESLGFGKAHFQPPASVRLSYPCIIYDGARADIRYADDRAYNFTLQYTVTIISRDPDEAQSSISAMLTKFPMCSHDRTYVADNLNHEVFSLFY